jgi:L,D-transpeptidase catalytic domain
MKGRVAIVVGSLALAAPLALPALASAQATSTTATTTGTNVTTAPDQPAAAAAQAQRERAKAPADAELRLALTRVHDHRLQVGNDVVGTANLRPFVPGQQLTLTFRNDDHVIKRIQRRVKKVPGHNYGQAHIKTPQLIKPSRYQVVAYHGSTPELGRAKASSEVFHITYPRPHGSGHQVGIFNDLLNKQGYRNAPNGSSMSAATGRAVLAFRKVNGMARTMRATSGIFRKLADGRGEFKPDHPGAGRHVEVDISRQVMALISHGKAKYTYHVSTGAPATPTVRGHYHFYSKTPGYNSLGMYYSVYFYRGYATHGYHSVPTYNASHGCVRNPIPDSRFIYDWIHLGESIYVYG